MAAEPARGTVAQHIGNSAPAQRRREIDQRKARHAEAAPLVGIIWYSEEARTRRKETVACDKLCLFTCLSQRTLNDKLKIDLTLLTGAQAS
jgi:hypothetical protein